jgi:hypothetical protein
MTNRATTVTLTGTKPTRVRFLPLVLVRSQWQVNDFEPAKFLALRSGFTREGRHPLGRTQNHSADS